MWRMMIYGVVMWAVTIYAFRRGGWEEKLASAGLVIGSYLGALLASSSPFHRFEGSILLLDTACFLLMLVILLLSRKFWPMWGGRNVSHVDDRTSSALYAAVVALSLSSRRSALELADLGFDRRRRVAPSARRPGKLISS